MNNEIYTTQTEEQVTAVTTETTETETTETTDIIIDATSTENNTVAVSSSGFINEQLNIPLTYKGERSIGSWLSQPYEEDEVGDVRYVPPLDQHYVLLKHEMNGWKVLPLLEAGRDIESMILPVNNVKDAKFGAEGDGETDDSDAIQAALNAGGIVYFPAGRYRVTKELKALTPCTIVMERMYPSSAKEPDRGGDYPSDSTADDVNPESYGARIETYVTSVNNTSTEDETAQETTVEEGSAEERTVESGSTANEPLPCGLLVGDGVSVDGLAIRAMEGFRGIVLKYDGTQGKRTYPSQTRLKHIRVDCASDKPEQVEKIRPVSMFDFKPHKTYGVIVEDVTIGTNHSWTYAEYGWRTELTGQADNIRMKNISIDMAAEYPISIDANEHQAAGWSLRNVVVQAYRYKQDDGKTMDRPPHINLVTLSGLTGLYISGCLLWDVDKALEYEGISGSVVAASSLEKVTAIGNDDYLNALDTTANEIVARQTEEINKVALKELKASSYATLAYKKNSSYIADGNNVLNPRSRNLTNASITVTDADSTQTQEALYAANDGQFIPYDFEHDGCVNNAVLASPTDDNSAWFKEGMWIPRADFWTTALIPCSFGDVVRFYYYGDHKHLDETTGECVFNPDERILLQRKGVVVCEYDRTGANCLHWTGDITNGLSENEYTVVSSNAEFIRVSFYGAGIYPVVYEDRADYIMATVNNALDVSAIQQRQDHAGKDAANYSDDTEWENISGIKRYAEDQNPMITVQVDLSQTVLTSPEGAVYCLSVEDGGKLKAVPMIWA